jgi:2-dehydro-3-deoxygalactonokinase
MTTPTAPLVGIDWGTSNRRAYVLDAHGQVVRQHRDELGILAVADFQSALADLLGLLELDRADVLMSGMVGSRNGWREVPYLSVDRPLSCLQDALQTVETNLPNVRCRIVPGYRFTDSLGLPDVMRGEETQVLGTLKLGADDGWFVLPGTHSKWVRVEHGAVAEIVTFMTGEFYRLLSRHGTLAGLMQEQPQVPDAFHAGLSAGQHGGFTHTAFCCRALVVTDQMPAAHTASYLSGLLIGAELRDVRQRTDDPVRGHVHVIGAPALAISYVDALEFFDMSALVWPPDGVYVAALRLLAGI